MFYSEFVFLSNSILCSFHSYQWEFLIPDASRAMVWQGLFSFGFQFLDFVVEEEVDEDGVDVGAGMVLADFSADEFDAPNAAGCVFC